MRPITSGCAVPQRLIAAETVVRVMACLLDESTFNDTACLLREEGPNMDYRKVGASDLEVSVLSLGTATFGGGNAFFKAWGETDVAEATSLVDIALDAGVNLFDSADVYSDGLAETILGKAIAGRRDQLLISTK